MVILVVTTRQTTHPGSTTEEVYCNEDLDDYVPVTVQRHLSEAADLPLLPDEWWIPQDVPMPEDEEEVYFRPYMMVDFNPSVKVTAVPIHSEDGIRHPVSVAFTYTLSGTSTVTEIMSDDNNRIFNGFTGEKILLPDNTPFIARLNIYIVTRNDVASSLGYTVSLDGCEETSK